MSGLVAWKGVIRRRPVTRRKILSYRAEVNLHAKRMKKESFCHVYMDWRRTPLGPRALAPWFLFCSVSPSHPLEKNLNFPTHPGITSGEDDGRKEDGGVKWERRPYSQDLGSFSLTSFLGFFLNIWPPTWTGLLLSGPWQDQAGPK